MNWQTFIITIMITVSCGISVLAQKGDTICVYVAVNGDDSWSGSISKPDRSGTDGPFATLQRAKDEIRAMKRFNNDEQIRVEIGPGIYHITNPLEFSAEDSGTVDAPIEYRAKIAGKTHLVCGHQATGFTLANDTVTLSKLNPSAKGNVYRSDLRKDGISDFETINNAGVYQSDPGLEVFFNNKPMTIARYPNNGYIKITDVFDANGIVESGSAANSDGRFICDDIRTDRWANEKDIWLHGFWFYDWADQRISVKSIDQEKHIISMNIQNGVVYGIRRGQWFYAENILSELDSPGEWYLDRDNGILYFWPPEPLTGGQVIVSTLRDPIRFNNASNIILKGLVIEDGRGTAVTINSGSNIQLIGMTIRNMGNWAVKANDGNGHKALGCDIYAMGQGGITFDGGDRKTLTPGNYTVENNHIHHTSRWDPVYQPGIFLFGVGNKAVHNLIDNVPHVAIGFSGNDQTIEYNEIHSSVFQSNDAGAIYTSPPDETWSMRGHKIRYNYLHNIHGFENKGCNGVYLDDCFSSADISGNIFYDVANAILIGGGRDNTISGNMFIDCNQALFIDARGLGWASSVGVFATKELHDLNYKQPPWSTKYPELLNILEDEPLAPKGNVVERNIFRNIKPDAEAKGLAVHRNTKWGFIEPPAQQYIKIENNLIDEDPLFAGIVPDDFKLSKSSPAFKLKFKQIPYKKIGVYKSKNRASWPVTSELRNEK